MKKKYIAYTSLFESTIILLIVLYLPFIALFMGGSIELFWIIFSVTVFPFFIVYLFSLFPPTIIINDEMIRSANKAESQKKFIIKIIDIKKIYLVEDHSKEISYKNRLVKNTKEYKTYEISDYETLGNYRMCNVIIESIDGTLNAIHLFYFTYEQSYFMLLQLSLVDCSYNGIKKIFPHPNNFAPTNCHVLYNKYSRLKIAKPIIVIVSVFFLIGFPISTLVAVLSGHFEILYLFYYAPIALSIGTLFITNSQMVRADKIIIINNYLFYTKMDFNYFGKTFLKSKENHINLFDVDTIAIKTFCYELDKKTIDIKMVEFKLNDGTINLLPIGLLSLKKQKILLDFFKQFEGVNIAFYQDRIKQNF